MSAIVFRSWGATFLARCAICLPVSLSPRRGAREFAWDVGVLDCVLSSASSCGQLIVSHSSVTVSVPPGVLVLVVLWNSLTITAPWFFVVLFAAVAAGVVAAVAVVAASVVVLDVWSAQVCFSVPVLFSVHVTLPGAAIRECVLQILMFRSARDKLCDSRVHVHVNGG